MLCLVRDHEPPADRGERRRVQADHTVGDQHHLIGSQIDEVPFAAVVTPDRDAGGEPVQLTFPGAEQRRRAHHQRRARA